MEEVGVDELMGVGVVCCARRSRIVGKGSGGDDRCRRGGVREVDDLGFDGGEERTEEKDGEVEDGDEEEDETALEGGESHVE